MIPGLATSIESRRRGPKVRTGCFTCKIRRVKCDETRPDCSRCTSTGRKCDGYTKPKNTSQVQVFNPSEPVSQFSGLGDSIRYLEFYHRCAVSSLSSRFDHEFWSRTSLQMAYAEPAVRHAIIALGCLNQTEPGSIKQACSNSQNVHSTRIILHHYNRAVRSLVDRMAQTSYSSEIGLVSCLLFVCIEFMRGNHRTAFTHLISGLRLVREWQQQQRRPELLFSGPTCTTSQKSLVQEVLLPMFQRGMASAQLHGVSTEEHFEIAFPSPDCSMRLPFSLQEAECVLRELRNASVLFVRQTGRKLGVKQPLIREDFDIQAQLIKCHRIWLERAQLAEDSQSFSADDTVAFSNLKVAHYATSTYLACATTVLQVPLDAYLHAFQTLIRHAEIVLDAIDAKKKNSQAAEFTFEISVVAPLYYAATRCRCPITRRKAVALLARSPPREGLWDADQHVIVANRAIELEEIELDPATGWPPERTRLWSSVIDANMDAQGGFWVYFLPVGWVGEIDATGNQRLIQERMSV